MRKTTSRIVGLVVVCFAGACSYPEGPSAANNIAPAPSTAPAVSQVAPTRPTLQANDRAIALHIDAHGVIASLPNEHLVRVATSTFGRLSSPQSLKASTPTQRNHRVELDHDGFVEWFAEHPKGIEHGFDVPLPPSGHGPLTFSVEFAGLDSATCDRRGRCLLTNDERSLQLYYSNPTAFDSLGRSLPTNLVVDAGATLSLRVDDTHAVYPIVVDPLIWVQWQRLVRPNNGAWDLFGYRVDLDGTSGLVAAIGEESDRGAVYELTRSSNGSPWEIGQKLVPVERRAADYFGWAMDRQGDTLVVSAPGVYSAAVSGRVLAFRRNPNSRVWEQTQSIAPSDSQIGDWFGQVLSLDGDTMAVGEASEFQPGESVHVYHRLDASKKWELVDRFDGSGGEAFGSSLALQGNHLLVGAPFENGQCGAIIAYERSSAGRWVLAQRWVNDCISFPARFGSKIAVNADEAVVLSFGTSSQFPSLAQLRWDSSTSKWHLVSQFRPASSFKGEPLGDGLILSDNTLLVSNSSKNQSRGVVYTFLRTTATDPWVETKELHADNSSGHAGFGSDVAYFNNELLVGGYRFDGARGAVFSFQLRSDLADPCLHDSTCGSGHCSDGVCCDAVCDASCDRCDLPKLEGICSPAPRGEQGSPSCHPLLCDGLQTSCPSSCDAHVDCSDNHFCEDTACLPIRIDGVTCASSSACQSGHCADGLCCDHACRGNCARCDTPDAPGVCKPVIGGTVGDPPCAPYLCDGESLDCPSSCAGRDECVTGYVCREGRCELAEPLGAKCETGTACISGFCTDGVCCSRSDCGAYRCGKDGSCPATCSSQLECADGHECLSSGRCTAVRAANQGDSSGCSISRSREPGRVAFWLAALVIAVFRRRRS